MQTLPGRKWQSQLPRLKTFFVSPSFVFLIVSLAVMGPLLLPGRLITLDAPLALNWDIAGYFLGTSNGFEGVFAATYNSAPVAAIHSLLGTLFPAWLVEKLWLILLFWLAGSGASRLPHIHGPGRYYAGILYAINPFTYVRFITGQWGVLGAYALTPFAITCFIRTLEEPRLSHALKLLLVLTIIGFVQIHGLALVLLVLAITYLFRLRFEPVTFRKTLPPFLIGGLIFLSFNLFWIVRYLTAGSVVENIGPGEMSFFAASPPLDVLSLRGFWLQEPYLDISNLIPAWWILFAPIIFLAVYGGLKMIGGAQTLWLAWALIAVTVTGMFLSAGPGVSLLEPVFRFLWENVPGYPAFRDSHKFVSLTALGYAYLGAFSVQYIFNGLGDLPRRRKWLVRAGLVTAMAVPVFYSLPIFGAWGQLKPADYPAEWNQVQSILDEDDSEYNVLALPWNMYMDFRWLENRWNRLANPAPNFFHQPTISGDNLEIVVTSTNSSNPVSLYIQALLEHRDTLSNFGNQIAPLNAKYVVLFEAGDSNEYGFLENQRDLENVFRGETISLYRNLSHTAPAYSVSEVKRLNSLRDYLEGDSEEDRTARAWFVGSGEIPEASEPASSGPVHDVQVVKINPVAYRVTGDSEGYLVFVLPHTTSRQGWTYGGDPLFMNLDMMPVFRASSASDTISFSRFYTRHVPLYVLALIAMVAWVVIYVRWRNYGA